MNGLADTLAEQFHGGPTNVSWQRALGGLSAEDASKVPAALPHSVAEVVAHVQFWQVYLLRVFRGERPSWPGSAAEGWPDPGEWEILRTEFLRDQEALSAYARTPTFLEQLDHKGRPRSLPLLSFAGHGLYHLGQVVSIRQALGLWPPPGGGDTW
ncbi:DinB family protein [Deinococcus irradiatisoli]|uniref:DinB family protein n=2 Tax=Deinococcus irradiatisoli TaxID=2202254 RepID=A0A2Z3JHK9_9DEIO|nr:DinB family protein [Deinococcus irradiatisoli]